MQTANQFDHAAHNYKLCQKLKELGGYDDWVVTTAFYSGLKFLQDKLFPGTYDHPIKHDVQEEFKSFPRYVSACKGMDKANNKHRIMSDLVDSIIEDRDVVNSYLDLKQSCHTARYINYMVGEDRAKMAIEAIDTIKAYCT